MRLSSLNIKTKAPIPPTADPAGKMRNYATATLAASLVARLAPHLLVAAIARRQLHAGFSVHAEPFAHSAETSYQTMKTNIHNHSNNHTFLDQQSS